MTYANGRIPAARLAPIVGSGPYGNPRLLREAAAAYNALHTESMRRWGISMYLSEGSVGRAYRTYARQVLAKRVYGDNAATPGTSNHGWGLAVDLLTHKQRWVIDQIGAKYGYAKMWSDAPWEWWHIKYRPGVWKGKIPPRVMRKGHRGNDVKSLQRTLRKLGWKRVRVDGHFGRMTRRAVKGFQRHHGLTPDGVVGPRTRRAMKRQLKKRNKKKGKK